jgi:MoaA/NifB/PqqE/SkfB family radical SAM enzyme
LVRRDIADIISYAKELGFVTIMNTNGSLLTQRASSIAGNLDFAFVSLDHPTEYHDYIRGRKGSFREVIEGIRCLLEEGGAKVTLVSTISKLNLNQMEGLARLAQQSQVGISYNAVESSWTAGYSEREASVVKDYGLSETEVRYFYNKLLDLKHRGLPVMESEWVLRDYAVGKPWVCHFPKMFVYVSPDGLIFPCTESFGHPLVDLRKTPFGDYFESDLFKRYVAKAEGCNECLRTCVRMYTYTYSANPLHLLSMTTAGRVWGHQIVGHRSQGAVARSRQDSIVCSPEETTLSS